MGSHLNSQLDDTRNAQLHEKKVSDRFELGGDKEAAREDYTSSWGHKPRQDINANDRRSSDGREDDGGGESSAVAPDGGWGWMVVLGCFIITTLLPGLGPCFGVLFSQYLLETGTSSTTTAWIFNTQLFMWNLVGLMTRPLTREFGRRPVAVVGAGVAGLGMILSAFTPSPEFLFFSFSLLTGAGGGLVTCICFTILPVYFDKKRGIANALMMGGVCLGQILCPPLARMLQDSYGQKGATLILGAILMNSCIGASLFHPIEWHFKPDKGEEREGEEEREAQEEKREALLRKESSNKLSPARGLVYSHSSVSFGESIPEDPEMSAIVMRARLARLQGSRRKSTTSSYASGGMNSAVSLSSMDLAGLGAMTACAQDEEYDETDGDSVSSSGGILGIFTRMAKTTVSDLSSFRSPRVCIVCLGGMLCINSYLNFLMMVPFAMLSAGLNLDDSAWCLSLSAVCNLVMRVLVSALSDLRWFKIRMCYMTGFLVISATSFVFPLMVSPGAFMGSMAVYGAGVGTTMGLWNLVMIDVMGVDRLATVFGASCFTVAVGFLCSGPLIGFIRDTTASYSISIRVTSAMVLASFLLWLLMPLACRYDLKREQKRQQRQDEEEEAA